MTLEQLIEKLFVRKEQLTNTEKQIIAAKLPQKAEKYSILSKILHGAGLASLWLWPWGHTGNFDYIAAFAMGSAYFSAIRLSDNANKYRAYLFLNGELEQKIVAAEIGSTKITQEIKTEVEKRISKYKTYASAGLPIAIATGLVLFVYRIEDVLPLVTITAVLTDAIYGRIAKYSNLLKRV